MNLSKSAPTKPLSRMPQRLSSAVAPDTDASQRSGFPVAKMDAVILREPPDALDEDVVDAASLTYHRYPNAHPFRSVGLGEGRDLAALIGSHYLGRAKLMDRLVRRLEAQVRSQRVRDALCQDLAAEPVHDGDQINEALTHGQICDMGALGSGPN